MTDSSKLQKNNTQKNYYSQQFFDIMSQVVSGSKASVYLAGQASKEDICVSITSVYNKLNGLEVNTSAELVRYAAGEVTPIITGLKTLCVRIDVASIK